jgi:beta-lactamase superfamily II metal-dependent hydrolase
MRCKFAVALAVLLVLSAGRVRAQKNDDLHIYFVDVEGGQSTLFVSPSGETVLVDTGFPGARDADRIAAIAKQAGVKQIDYLIITHYHGDHVGGVPELSTRIPIKTFIDHGPITEQTLNVPNSFAAYAPVREKGEHIIAKPGDKLPIKGLDWRVVSAAATVTTKALPGGGEENPLCTQFQPKDETKDILLAGENAASVGSVIALGKFRMIDFGDLTWNHEHDLACPKNLIGTVDLYLTTHHGQNISGLPMLVYAAKPRAVVMNNGSKKGGHVDTFQILHHMPQAADLWQLHYAVDAGDANSPEQFIANPDETTANYIEVVAKKDGSFTVTNSRNGFHKEYPPHQ